MSRQLTEYLRRVSKTFKLTFGARGFITLGRSGHLHSHVLLAEKRNADLSDSQLGIMDSLWRYQSKSQRIYDLDGVSSYVASAKHLVRESAVEPMLHQ